MKNSYTKYTAHFEKKTDMIYISHLDLMTVLRRAIRRSEIPFVLTEGFTRRVKISMPKALKLGIESDSEEMFLWLDGEINKNEIKENINKELPKGIKIREIL